MKHILLSIGLYFMAMHACHADVYHRSVQVTCAPELEMMNIRMLASFHYNDGPQATKALKERGIYAVPEDGEEIETTCKLPTGELKIRVHGLKENPNIMGRCGAEPPIPVVNLWLDDKQLIQNVGLQSCYSGYYTDGTITFTSEGALEYFLDVGENNYRFKRDTHESFSQPEKKLPITSYGR